jgi:hypothetical protein
MLTMMTCCCQLLSNLFPSGGGCYECMSAAGMWCLFSTGCRTTMNTNAVSPIQQCPSNEKNLCCMHARFDTLSQDPSRCMLPIACACSAQLVLYLLTTVSCESFFAHSRLVLYTCGTCIHMAHIYMWHMYVTQVLSVQKKTHN